jgi:hypothetical protein
METKQSKLFIKKKMKEKIILLDIMLFNKKLKIFKRIFRCYRIRVEILCISINNII